MSASKTVLVVDDEEYVRESLVELVEGEGYTVLSASNPREAQEELRAESVDVVLTDLRMPEGGGQALLESAEVQGIPVIVISGAGSIGDAVRAMKAGAFDFLQKPIDPGLVGRILARAIEHASLANEVRSLREKLEDLQGPSELVGDSQAMRDVRRLIAQVAPTSSTVLVLGESGTGKELAAREIHRQSPRSAGPYVATNCAAIPEGLFESELFGHRRGAFTGAHADRVGRLQEAEGGTLVLDEIGTLTLEAQAKLLRALESREFQVVGESRQRTADVRLVAMTNEDLKERVAAGAFREDLYYRLDVFPIVMPPLREHADDIVAIARVLLEHQQPRPVLAAEAALVLRGYAWPGNVRELRNVLERACILSGGGTLTAEDFTPILGATPARASSTAPARDDPERDLHLRRNLERLERELVFAALERAAGRKKEAAELLGIDPKNMAYYVKKAESGEAGPPSAPG